MSGKAPRVAIVGGGLAGLAAALALGERGCVVELFEARRNLGGRAGSFVDKATGETVDHCQHVAMGCCTNYLDFCRRVGAFEALRRVRTLHFIGPDGERCDFAPSRRLPAPLHLAGAMRRLTFLSLRERWSIARALAKLAKQPTGSPAESVGEWLRREGQTPRQIERFWSVVLVSALGEEIERASLAAARKVFVDGFMAAREAYEVYVPTIPLAALYDEFVARRLDELGVAVHRETAVERIVGTRRGVATLSLRGGASVAFDAYVLAVPWRVAPKLLDDRLLAATPGVARLGEMPAAPISAVHLWFDRAITPLDHAVLIGRLSQWVFSHGGGREHVERPGGWHYQVVISASRGLAGRRQEDVVAAVRGELEAVFPAAREAALVRGRLVTDRDAVFTPTAGWEALRPMQATLVPNLFVCGDWTATGWPATMESAVRSGRLAADAVLRGPGLIGVEETVVTPDLPRGWLSRLVIR